MKEQKCRVCGCTDYNCQQCINKTGHPCHWVEPDLCSACVQPQPDKPASNVHPIFQEIFKKFGIE